MKKLLLNLEDEFYNRIGMYRESAGISSQTAAIRELMHIALVASGFEAPRAEGRGATEDCPAWSNDALRTAGTWFVLQPCHGVSVTALAKYLVGETREQATPWHVTYVSKLLRAAGWERRQVRIDSHREWRYFPPVEWEKPGSGPNQVRQSLKMR